MSSVVVRGEALQRALKIAETKNTVSNQTVDAIAKETIKAAKIFEEYIQDGKMPK